MRGVMDALPPAELQALFANNSVEMVFGECVSVDVVVYRVCRDVV
jgi:hypothetical protein